MEVADVVDVRCGWWRWSCILKTSQNDQQQYPDLFSHLSDIVWACWHISWNLDWNFQIHTSRQPHVVKTRWDGICHGMCRVIARYCQKTNNTDVQRVLNLKRQWVQFVRWFYPYLGKMGPFWSISFKGVETDNLEIFLSSLTYASILEMHSPKLGAWIEEKIASIKEGQRHVESGVSSLFVGTDGPQRLSLSVISDLFQLVYSNYTNCRKSTLLYIYCICT